MEARIKNTHDKKLRKDFELILPKELVNKKIDDYYVFLDIDTLVDNFNKNFKEFERVKYKTSLYGVSTIPQSNQPVARNIVQ